MLTADTITDAQIHDLRSNLSSDGHTDTVYSADCHVALFGSGGARIAARARCAEMINRGRDAMECVCGHTFGDHDMLASTSCRADRCGCPRWGLNDMHRHREPQAIPVVNEQTTRLVALFDAALAAKPYSVTLCESETPGAAAALIAWARAKGLKVAEHHYVTEHSGGYANVEVALIPGRIAYSINVMNYRALTGAEIATIPVREREGKTERVGYGVVAL